MKRGQIYRYIDRQTDIATSRKNRPKGRFFEKLHPSLSYNGDFNEKWTWKINITKKHFDDPSAIRKPLFNSNITKVVSELVFGCPKSFFWLNHDKCMQNMFSLLYFCVCQKGDFWQQKSNSKTTLQWIRLPCYYHKVVSEMCLDHQKVCFQDYFVIMSISYWNPHYNVPKLSTCFLEVLAQWVQYVFAQVSPKCKESNRFQLITAYSAKVSLCPPQTWNLAHS